MRTNELLINESHLGTRLNGAVSGARRGEFALLLALMSSDARDMAQFLARSNDDADTNKLRAQFELGPEQPIVTHFEQAQVIDNSGEYQRAGLAAFRLKQSLRPEALVNRGEVESAMVEVLANTDPSARMGYLNPNQAKSEIYSQVPHFSEQLIAQRQFAELIV
ncbi:VC2046/SO_2500 family protein [Shewanella waksmanii]|uniref:VC2046/SO_2500 family protein n=1 Tax=Shewanella waksmanii TaxID=213783 RepID=UPI00048E94C3|nr:VC2046/SO_2500 family protein [Shewanella waksmanii]